MDTTDKMIIQIKSMLINNEIDESIQKRVEEIVQGVEQGIINISEFKSHNTDIKLKEVISIAMSRIV
ncbi:hypothetical protein [Paenibacillus ferrarius]|uniref:hypothetical protein n=1 Tax=Paenibacillus ferrarius TaxID=1469647 RepID=UPI003D2E8A9D